MQQNLLEVSVVYLYFPPCMYTESRGLLHVALLGRLVVMVVEGSQMIVMQ